MGRLSARAVATIQKPGLHSDGSGLYLQVTVNDTTKAVSRSWVFRYKRNGKLREMGLGPLHTVKLARAREDATRFRLMVRDGVDPIEQRKADRLAKAGIPTFWEEAKAYIGAHRASWSNPKHAGQWENTLATYAKPSIGAKPVSEVATEDVLAILEPIWSVKTETASRLRGRIEAVLDGAKAKGLRSGDNPARWRGHLDKLLPKPRKVRAVEHFPALPFKELPAFMRKLRKQEGIAAKALGFLVLTASRTGMVIGANRSEFSTSRETGPIWTVPAERMKAKRIHVIPLAKQASVLLAEVPKDGEPVFAGGASKPYLSNGAMDSLLERMGYSHVTVHGFRSTFKDWSSETTSFPNELSEVALAHTIRDKTEAAYRRGDLLQKRRKMMQAWADYCLPQKRV